MDTPVSNEVYDMLSILDSKLEALAAYDTYEKDMHDSNKKLLDQIRDDDLRHADMLVSAVETMARGDGLRKK